jgi:lipopolysaccharide/colanic/teichoic acid biosynthesis glycosyltransferase
LSPDAGLALDDEYVRTWTPMLDVRLLVKTVNVVFTQRGAV